MDRHRYQKGTSLDPIILDDDGDGETHGDECAHSHSSGLRLMSQLPTRDGQSAGQSESTIASKDALASGPADQRQTPTTGRHEKRIVSEPHHSAGALREVGPDLQKVFVEKLPQGLPQDRRSTLEQKTGLISEATVEACLLKHLTALHEEHAITVKEAMERSRMSLFSRPSSPAETAQQIDPFADMPSVVVGGDPTDKGSKASTPIYITSFESSAKSIPFHRRHLSFPQSALAENNWKLDVIPYFDDDNDKSKHALFWEELKDKYDVSDIKNRSADGLRALRYDFHHRCVEAVFEEVGVNWESTLFWFLAPGKKLRRIFASSTPNQEREEEFKAYLHNRHECEESEKRSRKEWAAILARLPAPAYQTLWACALVCKPFKRHWFSMWELAQRSQPAEMHLRNTYLLSENASQLEKTNQFLTGICGVCYQFDCLLHGELVEDAKPSKKHNSAGRAEAHDSKKQGQEYFEISIVDPVVNYKRIVNARIRIPSRSTSAKFNVRNWLHTGEWESRETFFPCDHPGSCKDARCRCFMNNILCEKTCGCAERCRRRYPGCSCAQNGSGDVCGASTSCECRQLKRECDADVCGGCGAAEVLDPRNREEEDVGVSRCCNVDIQRGVPKKTLAGQSTLHGIGLFTAENVEKGDFLGEYTGDLITVAEGDRRGTIYPYQGLEYLFQLNRNQEIDATRAGSNIRFINCSPKALANCEVRVLLCNTVLRIGCFANRNLGPATELLFDYNYPDDKMQTFVQPKGVASPVKEHSAAPQQVDIGSSVTQHKLSAGKSAGARVVTKPKSLPKASSSTKNINGARKSGMAREVGLRDEATPVADTNTNQTTIRVQSKSSSTNFNTLEKNSRRCPGDDDDDDDDEEYVDETPSESGDSYVDATPSETDDTDHNEANANRHHPSRRSLGARTSSESRKPLPAQTAVTTTSAAPKALHARKSAPLQPRHNIICGQKRKRHNEDDALS
ncbi:uncharacterized protein EI97DRAFT_403864 [Westerdykella ornata]|uniref:SET domain-containing protein n=1 Tax=Westerdykella ornata TaxID=318751 RepID=A0A6A6JBP9_WESOR|nr:uncharacterized protein EI97DRAFT_403864 [Westerdykella ornata]KAF2273715.1 hypothetical protein EI97DRAFT_403864 [Westerdykella ornata]